MTPQGFIKIREMNRRNDEYLAVTSIVHVRSSDFRGGSEITYSVGSEQRIMHVAEPVDQVMTQIDAQRLGNVTNVYMPPLDA